MLTPNTKEQRSKCDDKPLGLISLIITISAESISQVHTELFFMAKICNVKPAMPQETDAPGAALGPDAWANAGGKAWRRTQKKRTAEYRTRNFQCRSDASKRGRYFDVLLFYCSTFCCSPLPIAVLGSFRPPVTEALRCIRLHCGNQMLSCQLGVIGILFCLATTTKTRKRKWPPRQLRTLT